MMLYDPRLRKGLYWANIKQFKKIFKTCWDVDFSREDISECRIHEGCFIKPNYSDIIYLYKISPFYPDFATSKTEGHYTTMRRLRQYRENSLKHASRKTYIKKLGFTKGDDLCSFYTVYDSVSYDLYLEFRRSVFGHIPIESKWYFPRQRIR